MLIASLIFRQEKLTFKKIFACVLGFAGIVIVNLNGLELSMNLLGDGFVIFSTISSAFSSVLVKRFSADEDPVVISGYQFIAGGIFLVVLGLALGGTIKLADLTGLLVLLYLAIVKKFAEEMGGNAKAYLVDSRFTIEVSLPVSGVSF